MISIVGMGPGRESMMTQEALDALERADVIIGYTVYLELLGERFAGKEFLSTPMKQEVERCRMCFEEAAKGRDVAMICSGDAGIYGMASLMFEIGEEYDKASEDGAADGAAADDSRFDIEVIPGITAASSGAAVLGAPLNHDFCAISLSDLLTPWDLIEKRLRAAAEGDFAIAIYNPSSKKRHDYLQKACDILLEKAEPERACGYVRSIGRDGEEFRTCTLGELRDTDVDMFTTVFIGNSQSRIMGDRLITPRGYRL
jgi:precorrin-3B C17-methyltransferase